MGSTSRRLSAALLALASAAGLAACGGGKSEEDVEALLDRAFRAPVRSADVKVDAQLEIDGLQGFERPVRLEASGPYLAGEDGGLPRLDIDLKVGSQEAGQTVQSGFLSTGDRAFLKFGGEFYEQPREDVERARRELREQSGEGSEGTLGDLGLDPREWVVDSRSEGDDEIAGVDAEHVSGKLDVRAVFADFNELVQRSSSAVGGAPPGTPQPLSEADLERLPEIVRDPTFDVYVGKEDGAIRRISANVQIVVPEADRARFGGIEGGTLRFAVELADVNGDQKVQAPPDARPIEDLTTQLGGLGALGGRGGAPGPGVAPAPGVGEVPGAAGDAPDPDALQRYADCLDETGPADSAERSRCAELHLR